MSDSDSAWGSERPPSRTHSNPPPETSKITPSSAQPPPLDISFSRLNSTSRASSKSLLSRTPNGSVLTSLSSLDLAVSPGDPELSLRRNSQKFQSTSFQYSPSDKPPHQELKLSFPFPPMPFQVLDPVDPASVGKYRPLTKSPSDGSDVRWYFCQTIFAQNEVAASVPPTELVGKGEYFRFSKGDSDVLEAAFLQREEELVRAWWKEYAESGEGPSSLSPYHEAPSTRGRLADEDSKDFDSSRRLGLSASDEEETVGVVVKGGLYEVDLHRRRCSPVYWRGDHRRVLRGHWFARKGGLDWLPLREDISEQLEIAYVSQIWRRRRFQPSGLYAARVNLHGATQGLHALFTGEDDSWEAWLCVDTSGISFVLGLRGSGVKLRRGFALPESNQPTHDEVKQQKEEEMDDYASKVPVRHVVFMVHGIGQRLEKANLVDDVGAFRRTFAALADQHLTPYQREAQRILFIPCQWRRGLKLSGESTVEDCTLEGIKALRTMLSATVHDVLYYMSPVYCQDIIDSLSHSLNKLYEKFVKRNPKYDGKVSIYGHSLGTVLAYDILCHQTAEASSSLAPLGDVTVNAVETTSSSTNSEIQHSASLPPEVDGGPQEHSSRRGADSESSGEVRHSHSFGAVRPNHTDEELDQDTQNHESTMDAVETDRSQDEQTEVKALRAEVKLLQDKLSALTQQQSPNGKSAALSSGDHRTAEMSESSDSEGSYRVIGSLEDGTAFKSRRAIKAEDSQADSKSASKKPFTPRISYTKLDFAVETFYAVGSPLGVFLSLRNMRIGVGLGQEYWQDDVLEEEMPAVKQMMNIFHPYDPVAYRLEPLVCREYVKKRPKFIPYHKGGKRLHIGLQEFQEDLSARSKAILQSLGNVKTRVAKAFYSPSSDKTDVGQEEHVKARTYGEMMMERLTAGSRLDYQLQDATFEHQYIAVLSSHTGYWSDIDTALFILRHLYRDIPREAPAPISGYQSGEYGSDGIQEESDVPDFSNAGDSGQILGLQGDSDSDEVSLTFSSRDAIAAALADANKVKANWMDQPTYWMD